MANVDRVAVGIQQRRGQLVLVLWRMDVPEFFWLPFFRHCDTSLLECIGPERLAAERSDRASLLANLGAERVSCAGVQVLQGRGQRDLPLAH